MFGPCSEVFKYCSEVFKYCSEVLGSGQPAIAGGNGHLVSCHVVQWCFSAELDNMTEKDGSSYRYLNGRVYARGTFGLRSTGFSGLGGSQCC